MLLLMLVERYSNKCQKPDTKLITLKDRSLFIAWGRGGWRIKGRTPQHLHDPPPPHIKHFSILMIPPSYPLPTPTSPCHHQYQCQYAGVILNHGTAYGLMELEQPLQIFVHLI